jgi:hypothetical protein
VSRGRAALNQSFDEPFCGQPISSSSALTSLSGASHASLTGLLRHRLAQVDETTNSTWAERLIETWIIEAVKGNFRALQEILNRVDGAARVDGTPEARVLALDERTSAKILEALCDQNDRFPGD